MIIHSVLPGKFYFGDNLISLIFSKNLIQLSERYVHNEIEQLLYDKHVTCRSYGGYTRSIILSRLVTQNTRTGKKRRAHALRVLYLLRARFSHFTIAIIATPTCAGLREKCIK